MNINIHRVFNNVPTLNFSNSDKVFISPLNEIATYYAKLLCSEIINLTRGTSLATDPGFAYSPDNHDEVVITIDIREHFDSVLSMIKLFLNAKASQAVLTPTILGFDVPFNVCIPPVGDYISKVQLLLEMDGTTLQINAVVYDDDYSQINWGLI